MREGLFLVNLLGLFEIMIRVIPKVDKYHLVDLVQDLISK